MYDGYKLSLVPIIKQLVENTFGHRLAPHVFIDLRKQLAKDARVENLSLYQGELVTPNEMDNHQQHMAMHKQSAQELGDPHRTFEVHMQMHQIMLQKQAQAQQAKQQGNPGAPGGAGQPGLPGQGAQAQGPNQQAQQPNGAIPQDQMAAAGSPMPPRRMG
jgi:hypothetical protein